MKIFKDKYLGHRKIKDFLYLESKTFLGEERIKVTLEDKEVQELPVEMLEATVTDKKSDATDLRNRRVFPVVEKILAILADSELSFSEISYATGPRLKASIDDTLEKSYKKIWGKARNDISLRDIQNKLEE